MFLLECITFSVNTTVHGFCLEQSEQSVSCSIYLDLTLLLLICSLL